VFIVGDVVLLRFGIVQLRVISNHTSIIRFRSNGKTFALFYNQKALVLVLDVSIINQTLFLKEVRNIIIFPARSNYLSDKKL
jgi:hypothetical protein